MTARVLIIEDNPPNLELMRYLLTAFGHTVTSSTDGEGGIAAARREAPDIIICDVQLPGMSGIDVASALKKDSKLMRIPLVAVTAFAMLGDDERLLKAGFDGYISKPIDPVQFTAQMDAFLPPDKRSMPRTAELQTSASLAAAPRNGSTILVVDNVQANLDFASSMLEPLGYRVVTATSMDEALGHARQLLPDLIISDVCMPGGDGYDLIAEVKKDPRLKAIPFIFVTSTAIDAPARQKGLGLGAAKYLVRPIEPRKFLAEIEACLDRKRTP
jgi:two-component system cell cycle response regulator